MMVRTDDILTYLFHISFLKSRDIFIGLSYQILLVEQSCVFLHLPILICKWQDSIIIKPPKKSPASLRTLVLVFAMACGIYICSVCLKQTNIHTSTKLIHVEVSKRHCHDNAIDRSQTPFLHYPKPNSFSRWISILLFESSFASFL